MKKICFTITFLMLLLLCPVLLTGAIDMNPSDYYRVTKQTTSTIFQNITYDHILAETRTDRPSGKDQGLGGTKEIDPNKWYGQQINVINIPANNEAQIIPWSVQNGFNWSMIAVTDMAKDFEEKHPEYVVLGGVNGDFYDWHNTKDFGQSGTGLEVVGGNMLRYHGSGWNGVGFVKDENTSKIVYIDGSKVARTALPVLTIYDENNNELKSIALDKFNENITNGETAAYFGRIIGEKGTNKYNEHTYITREYLAPLLGHGQAFIVENADRVIYQADDNSYYGYGQISTTDASVIVPSTGFAVVTKNPEVEALLSIGTYIRVQYVLTGEYQDIQHIIGGKMSLISNGVLPEYTTDAYLTERVPRTIVGQKADGTLCLFTMDGRQSARKMYGTNQQEINAFMVDYGISDAVLLDGGGSSTFFVREGEKFVVKNSPSDTGEANQPRNVGNCLLVVMKRADFALTNTEIKDNSITFTLDTSGVDFSKIKAIKCTLDGETLKVRDNKVTFNNLDSNTTYNYVFTYDTANQENIETMVRGTISSAKKTPYFGSLKVTIGNNKLIFNPEITDTDEALDYYRIFLNNKRNPYLGEPIEVKYDLTGLTTIEFDILICYDLNDGLGKVERTEHIVYDLTTNEDIFISNPTYDQVKIKPEKGCKKDISMLFIGIISLGTTLLVIKKRDE